MSHLKSRAYSLQVWLLFRILRSELALYSYTLQNVANAVLAKRIPYISNPVLTKAWSKHKTRYKVGILALVLKKLFQSILFAHMFGHTIMWTLGDPLPLQPMSTYSKLSFLHVKIDQTISEVRNRVQKITLLILEAKGCKN